MSANEYGFTDRYKALGVPYPDSGTMCAGQCEGVGVYPQFLAGPWLQPGAARLANEVDEIITEEEISRWHQAHLGSKHEISQNKPYVQICDGWHFITCPDCDGTGKAALEAA